MVFYTTTLPVTRIREREKQALILALKWTISKNSNMFIKYHLMHCYPLLLFPLTNLPTPGWLQIGQGGRQRSLQEASCAPPAKKVSFFNNNFATRNGFIDTIVDL